MLAETGMLPDKVVACVGGGSNAMGIFSAFLNKLATLVKVFLNPELFCPASEINT